MAGVAKRSGSQHEPTDRKREQVKALSGLGAPQEFIAFKLGICPQTLRKHYRTELDWGMTEADMQVAGALFKKAISGDVTSAIFWAKTRMGWKETSVLENKVTIEEAAQDDANAFTRRISRLAAGAGEDEAPGKPH